MPNSDAVDRERAVVQQVLAALRSASGLAAELVGSPDEERDTGRFPAELTVDAVLALSDGETTREWALDVINLAWNPLLIPAIAGFQDGLQAVLDDLASERGVSLSVMYQPPIGHPDRGVTYRDQILDYARRLIDREEPDDSHLSAHPLAIDPNTGVDINPFPGQPGVVVLFAVLTETANVLELLQANLAPAVQRKLAGQLLRAHRAGYPTILAIDQVGPPSEHGNNFLASSASVGQTLSRTVIRHEHAGGQHALDLAVLVNRDSTSPVFGYWPDSPDP